MSYNAFIYKNGFFHINPKLAHYFFTTHGIPVEVFNDMINEKFPPRSKEKAIQLAIAYDVAKGTKITKKITSIIKNL